MCVGAEINLQLIAAEAPPGTYEREETCIFPRDAGGVSIKFENYAATLNACVCVYVCREGRNKYGEDRRHGMHSRHSYN